MCAQVYRYAVTDTEVGSTCLNVRLLTDPRHGQVFYGTFFAFAFVLPMTLICALYARMLVRLLRRHAGGALGGGPGPHGGGAPGGGGGSVVGGQRSVRRGGSSTESARARRRVTRLVVVVVAVFGACWLPIHVVFIVQYFHAAAAITHAFVGVRLAASCLAYANSCLNPILYAFLSDHFRSGLARLCGRGGAQQRGTVAEARSRRQREMRTGRGAAGDDGVVRPLLAALEGRDCSAKDVVVREKPLELGGVAAALQVPATCSRRAETTATVETAL